MRMYRRAWHGLVALLCVAGFALVLFRSISHEVHRAQLCDTTYIHPRYERVKEAGYDGSVPYSLVRYREVPSTWVPAGSQPPGRVAVLFVPGHLGSHEQMRSMASETAKEISRRMREAIHVDGVDWYGVDFVEEPSGLEPRLLKRQAAYVAWCLDHLSSSYDKVVLLGYSMGGIVVDRVLSGMDGEEGIVDSIAMVITIGSPHFHLPTLMVPNLQNGRGQMRMSGNSPPTLRVSSGPGDLLVPSISAWSIHAKGGTRRGNIVEVDSENIPGVWATISHKGLVSCNQLVRRIVPLILDGARLPSSAEVQRLMTERMTTDVQLDVMELDGDLPTGLATLPARETCALVDDAVYVVSMEDVGKADSPRFPCYIKHVDTTTATPPRNDVMLQFAFHGMMPGRDVWLIAMDGEHEVGSLSHLLSPLPAMAIDEPTDNNRHWQQVIQGIQWMQNSTWFLEASGRAFRDLGATSVMIVLSDESQHTSGSQNIQGRGFTAVSVARADRHHPRPGTIKGTSVISIDIPSTLLDSTRLMRWFVPILDWKQLAQFVPMKLVVKAVDCVGAGDRNVSLPHSPVMVSKKDPKRGVLDSDQLRTHRASFGALNREDGIPANRIDVPLWHPSLLSNTVHVLVDPTCRYSVVSRPDILPAVAYAARYHAYALPGLLLALNILRLVPVSLDHRGRWSVQHTTYKHYGFMTTSVAVTGTVLSRVLTAWRAEYVPWLFLQTPLSISSILWLAICLDITFKYLACICINLAGNVVPEKVRSLAAAPRGGLRRWVVPAVLVASVLHDFAAFFIACVASYVLAVCRSDVRMGRYTVVEWGFLLVTGVSPMVIAMSGGKLIPYPHREMYNALLVERLLVAFVSLGSAVPTEACPKERPRRRAASVLAAVATLSSLFGYCFVGPFIILLLVVDSWML